MRLFKFNKEAKDHKPYQLIIRFYLLLILTMGIIFYTPKFISISFLLATLYFYYRSNIDYYWFAYAFVITFDIGGIFQNHITQLLSIYQFDITYLTLFSIVSFIKYLKSGKVSLIFIKNYYILYGVLFIVLLIFGLFSIGLSGGGKSGFRYITFFLQSILYIPLIVTIPKSINSYDKVAKIFTLLIGLIPLNLIGQIYFLGTGITIGERYNLNLVKSSPINVIESEITLRPELGSAVRFFAFIGAIFLYFVKKYEPNGLKKHTLMFLIFLNIISTFITATRGWIISYSFILTISLLFSLTKLKGSKILIPISFFLILSVIIIHSNEILKVQFKNSLNRLFTIEAILEGDRSEIESIARLSVRHEEVMEIFYKYPVFGTGISSLGFEKFDQHTGNQSILATGGMVEFIIFLIVIFSMIFRTMRINSLLSKYNVFKNKILLFIIFLGGLLIIHSTSSFKFGLVGWLKFSGSITYVILFFSLYNQIMIEAINTDRFILSKHEI